jgi:hypothetical protein
MKKNLIFLAFTILWPIEIYCQNINDVSDRHGVIFLPVNDSTIVYNTKKGEEYEIRLKQISFVDGENALVDYLKKKYYKPRPSDDDYAYRVFFFILFDSKLQIKEVRDFVLPLNQYTESKKKRVKLYTKGLKKTKNRWKKKSNQKWYVYSFSFVTD